MEKVHSLISLLIRAVNFTSIFYKRCILLPQNSHTSLGILLFAVMHACIPSYTQGVQGLPQTVPYLTALAGASQDIPGCPSCVAV